MVLFFSFTLFLYAVLIVFLLLGWEKVIITETPGKRSEELITILIPARNEAGNISFLLDDLQQLDDSLFEVIVIDDHSDDDTPDQVSRLMAGGFNKLRMIKLENGQGKKRALISGVEAAQGSLIVTVDADCRVGQRWLLGFRKLFSDPSVKLAFGAVRIHQDKNLWSSVQAIELASLIGSGAAFSGLGFPILCNGANLAYRKEIFLLVGGYSDNEHIPSGDDGFLMKKIRSRFPGSVRFVYDPENVVETKGVTFSEFVHQRIRWAGKWGSNNIQSMLTALLIFCVHLAYLGMVITFLLENNLILLTTVIAVKSFLEFNFLQKVMLFLRSKWNWPAFIFLQITYPFYVVIIGVLANLKSPVWKGRKIRPVDLEIDRVLRQNH